jgi:50S ribosomal subunit-associated GTPase HflX
METDKRAIREKIVLLTREISLLGMQREQHRKSRYGQNEAVRTLF